MDRARRIGIVVLASFALAACGNGPGGGGGSDGGTDGGTACGPDPSLKPGKPITAPAKTWTWIPFPDTQCMDGSPTGLGVNLVPGSDKVLIFLEGGGACFDNITCGSVANPNGYDGSKFNSEIGTLGSAGIFDRTNPDNPVKDYSFVYIPYCSGDVYAGDAPKGFGGRVQVGYENIGDYLKRLVPTFDKDKLVVLSGSSAGGFGSAWNYDRVQTAFGCTPVYLLDDSGPPLADQYMKPCLQKQWRADWNLDATLPKGCTKCTESNGGGLVNLAPYLANKYPNRRLALLSHTQDRTIRLFFSYGYSSQCNFPGNMPAADFEAGLTDLRDNVLKGDKNFNLFLQTGSSHTFLHGSLSAATASGTTLASWIDQEVTDDPHWGNAGP